MPIAAFTFGSFGDIASVIQLVWRLRAALNDATSASADVQSLVADMDEFTRALLRVKAVLEERQLGLQPAVLNGIALALAKCVDVLKRMELQIRQFRERMIGAVGVDAWRQYWAAAAWSIMGGKTQVDSLRSRLSEQLNVIQVYLSLVQCNNQALLQKHAQLQSVALDRLFSVMHDIQMRFDVGVPPFQFFDTPTGKYYQACARISLQRFLEVCRAYMSEPFALQERDLVRLSETDAGTCATQVRLKAPTANVIVPPIELDCLLFREHAFSEWQLLLGMPSSLPETQQVLKILLERRHAIGAPCTCVSDPCRSRFVDEIAQSRLRNTLAQSYAEAANRIIKLTNHAVTLALSTDTQLSSAFRAHPDPEYVRYHVIPHLEFGKRFCDMTQMLLDAPKLTGREKSWASNFRIASPANPLVDPAAPWFFHFSPTDPDPILPSLL